MKVELQDSFIKKLNRQINYIAHDKPSAARSFKKNILERISEIKDYPYKHRKSIFFDDDTIRDLVYQGYICVYKIDIKLDLIIVFGFVKYQGSI